MNDANKCERLLVGNYKVKKDIPFLRSEKQFTLAFEKKKTGF